MSSTERLFWFGHRACCGLAAEQGLRRLHAEASGLVSQVARRGQPHFAYCQQIAEIDSAIPRMARPSWTGY